MSKKQSAPLQLNKEQQQAVNAAEGVWAVVAGPGSGKSECLVQRYKRLRRTGIQSENILSLTFTNEAAKSMRTRAEFVNSKYSRPCGFLTFHSLALSFATLERDSFPYRLAPFPLATDGQSAKFIGQVIRKYRIDFRHFRQWLSLQKRLGKRPNQVEYPDSNYIKAYAEYETLCRQAGILDFDSLIMEMVSVLENNPSILDKYGYEYIQIDETQDCDEIQLKMLQLLSNKHGNVWACGDANQSVYQFRGANPDLFLKFHEFFPNCQYLFLGQNYRSSQSIVSFVKSIAPIKNELLEKMDTQNELGHPPKIIQFMSDTDETKSVINEIKTTGATENSAILARTNRQLRAFEDGLFSNNIRYYLLGKTGFYSQTEIRNVLAYVQLSMYKDNANALLTAIRAPFWPSRFIRKKELTDTLERQRGAEDTKFDNDLFYQPREMFDLLEDYRTPDSQQQNSITGLVNYIKSLASYKNLSAGQAVSGIIGSLKALDYYDEEEEAIDNNPQENIEELARIAGRFPSIGEFLDHVRKVQNASRVKKGVALGTIHAAKGREYNSVFLVGCSEGILPHIKGDLEEEERIWFVGCSRAAKNLHISYVGPPSRFLQPFIKVEKPPEPTKIAAFQ